MAHAAGDPSDTISDYQFSPASLTVNAGDTVTWTNAGPTEHTATARNGSFDTGLLKKGQSASHTFTQPGTYAYICTIHPFMHGTIVVLAASTTTPSTSTPSGSNGSGTTAATTTSPTDTSGALPRTGADLATTAITGLLLVALGLGLRFRRRRRSA